MGGQDHVLDSALTLVIAQITTAGTGNWPIPANVHSALVRCIGAGGGSGGGQLLGGSGAGGGGGEYQEQTFDFDALGYLPGHDTIPYQCGVGGTAGAATSGHGGTGGDSWFISTSSVKAKGGVGGAGNTGAAGTGGTAGVGRVGFNGGNGAAWTTTGGGGGGSAGSEGVGGNAATNSSTAGTAGPGTALPGQAGSNRVGVTNGNPGVQPGGGAGSGINNSNSSTGARGGDGIIQIEYEAYTVFDGSGDIHQAHDAVKIYLDGNQLKRAYLDGDLMWEGLTSHTVSLTTPGQFTFDVPPRTKWITFEAGGAHGGPGGSNSVALGAPGGVVRGRLDTSNIDVLYGYVGHRGLQADSDPTAQGGEPGGACSKQNIFGSEQAKLGGVGGGYTGVWADEEFEPVIVAGGGGGSAGTTSGGQGGYGGGRIAGGAATGSGTSPQMGTGGGGGTQVAGGVEGIGAVGSNGGDHKHADPGIHLAGGSTWRFLPYGGGVNPHSCGGGGGGGWYGGGGGGNGASAGGGGGGGGGGSSYTEPTRVSNIYHAPGANASADGYLTLTFLAPFDWTP